MLESGWQMTQGFHFYQQRDLQEWEKRLGLRVEGLPASGAEQVAERVIERGRAFARLVRPAIVNGAPGTVAERDGKILGAMACTVRNGRIVTMDLVVDPDRFRRSGDS